MSTRINTCWFLTPRHKISLLWFGIELSCHLKWNHSKKIIILNSADRWCDISQWYETATILKLLSDNPRWGQPICMTVSYSWYKFLLQNLCALPNFAVSRGLGSFSGQKAVSGSNGGHVWSEELKTWSEFPTLSTPHYNDHRAHLWGVQCPSAELSGGWQGASSPETCTGWVAPTRKKFLLH